PLCPASSPPWLSSLSLHDALPIFAIDIEPPGDACPGAAYVDSGFIDGWYEGVHDAGYTPVYYGNGTAGSEFARAWCAAVSAVPSDRKSTRLNSSHEWISYAVFCLK